MWLFALYATKSTLEGPEKGKQVFDMGFKFINNECVNRNINN